MNRNARPPLRIMAAIIAAIVVCGAVLLWVFMRSGASG